MPITRLKNLVFVRIFLLLLIATPALAQDPIDNETCPTPHAAVESLVYWQQPQHYDLFEAARCLDLSREESHKIGPLRAEQMKEVMDARGLVVQLEVVPSDANYKNSMGQERFTPFPKFPKLYLEKVGHKWLWSASSVENTPRLYDQTFVVDVNNVVNKLPDWAQKQHFGISAWQVLGLFFILLLAIAIRSLVTWLVAGQARRVMQRAGAKWGEEVLTHIDRPIGSLAATGVIPLLVPSLLLPARFSQACFFLGRLLAAYSIVWALYRLVDLVSAWLELLASKTETKLDDQLVPLVRRALKIFIVAFGAVAILQNLSVDVAGLVAGLGLGGLAFALAAKDTISNLFGSATIFADRPFQIGDWIIVSDIEGIVESVGFRSTKIRTFYNSLVTIPNAKVADAIVDNYGARTFRRIRTTLALRYDTTPEQIEIFIEGVRDIIMANSYVRADDITVALNEMSPSALNILVNCFLRVSSSVEEHRERQDLYLKFLALAQRLNISFAYPTQTLHIEPSIAQPNKRV